MFIYFAFKVLGFKQIATWLRSSPRPPINYLCHLISWAINFFKYFSFFLLFCDLLSLRLGWTTISHNNRRLRLVQSDKKNKVARSSLPSKSPGFLELTWLRLGGLSTRETSVGQPHQHISFVLSFVIYRPNPTWCSAEYLKLLFPESQDTDLEI